MAKRFTDTNKYKKPFIRGLQGPYKLLWDYLYHDCDHVGIWIVDFEIAQLYLGVDMKINKKDALKYFNTDEERIIEFDAGKKWFIKPFVEFQYGILNEQNRVHNSVLNELKKYNLDKALISPLQRAKDKDKDKDKDMDMDLGGDGGNKEPEKTDFIDQIVQAFAEAHGNYEIINRGKEREMAGKILRIYKKKFPLADSQETIEALSKYFQMCLSIQDDWLRNNMSLSIIVSKYNEINTILRNGNKKGPGATDAELAAIVAKHFGTG